MAGAHELTSDNGRPLVVVHRDVSPHNVFISFAGAVKLGDWGIASRVDAEVTKRTAAVEAELVTLRAELAERVRGGFYEELAARAVDRRDLVRTRYVDRNADDLIVRVGEVMYLGDAAISPFYASTFTAPG